MLAGVSGGFEQPVGVVLAGGQGRRIGGEKAIVSLAGRPLVSYPVNALRSVLSQVRVVAKAGTELPALHGVEVWTEPAQPHHPLVGIVEALRRAAPRAVLVCAADMPFLTAEAVSALAFADARGAPAVVAVGEKGLEPLFARYEQSALDRLARAAAEARAPMREVVAALGPRRVPVDPDVLFNINSPGDVKRAEQIMRDRGSLYGS
jgi:molybdopterin-guanine dinucleotide biosynthesis protein A